MDNNLTITVISRSCGIPTPTLRIWEKRYGAFSPTRDNSGQRLYSEEDLLRAKQIAVLLQRGYAISSVVHHSSEELRKLLDNDTNEFSSLVKKDEVKKLLGYVKEFHIEKLAEELQYLRVSTGAKGFIFNTVLPLMKEIGNLVALEKCSVTQEHIVSSLIRDQLSKITLPLSEFSSAKIALATPEGNLHELPIIIADILCRTNRVSTCYLGAAHPAQCLGEAVSALKCETIVMGALSSDKWNYEENIASYLGVLDKALKHKVKIILGGGWHLDFPKFKNISEVVIMSDFEELDKYLSHIF